ncbi:LLM class flavin-dependent oxidoreductase [Agrobacterium rubi]|uniref:LLM class flavin-dependent oxidoreductase n=1 Tax=Agrobacterium rubi TaxID=28099 RepID=UPI0015720A17|nr:LLM class flavin-dependent oxidoreductase [Agrobacterium rubi]NTF08329.1 LLM class flavin-dependent oxidoreductase [Agrobacterium rubi]NTF20557.1 LLM class flavin-dependent oxidoreductase [Agrobacterium rubi]NTF27528.1 LLM class flavin-dependent oxidoreductase [Agrobacterium rubi]
MIPFSILDLSPIGEGENASKALDNSRRMAIKAEEQGYERIWLAEHHGMPGIASAATAIVIAHVGAATSRIRVGSGGVMLPNHSPLVIAEQFGTLDALLPGRVDLGLGRAPGTDMRTARALRRNLDAGAENFPHDIIELQQYLGAPQPDQAILSVPGMNSNVPIWLLGSSTYSAHLAAMLGLPYSFASHFAPDMLMDAIAIYRERFQPSATLKKPYVMVGVMGVGADTDDEAEHLFTSAQQQFVNLRKNVRTQFPRPVDNMDDYWNDMERITVDHTLRYAVVGSHATVEQKLGEFLAATDADELIVSMPVHDIQKRLRSVEVFAEVRSGLRQAA